MDVGRIGLIAITGNENKNLEEMIIPASLNGSFLYAGLNHFRNPRCMMSSYQYSFTIRFSQKSFGVFSDSEHLLV
jgi:hypothetical protein